MDDPAKSRSERLVERLQGSSWRLLRIPIGVALVFGGLLGFLPLVGFWMLPLGLSILAVDIPIARRILQKLGGLIRTISDLYRRFGSR